mmetsp:Transcript_75584/g.152929  ORF Transcript_75584/g.152929 Transcript_75584/m.152929 type:complete len:223 (-) Transcript_75584:207-875(-)
MHGCFTSCGFFWPWPDNRTRVARWKATTFPKPLKLCEYKWMGPWTLPPKCIGKIPAKMEVSCGTKAICMDAPPKSKAPKVVWGSGLISACSWLRASHPKAPSSSPERTRTCSSRVTAKTLCFRKCSRVAAITSSLSRSCSSRSPAVAPRYSGTCFSSTSGLWSSKASAACLSSSSSFLGMPSVWCTKDESPGLLAAVAISVGRVKGGLTISGKRRVSSLRYS